MTKNCISLLSVVFVMVSLSACSGGDTSTVNSPIPSTQELNKEQRRLYAESHKPAIIKWSEDEDDVQSIFEFSAPGTPTSIGQVVSLGQHPTHSHQYQSGNCQGSLIAPDLFLTNRHCIPKRVLAKKVSCAKRVKILLPKLDDDTDFEKARCSEVVATSQTFDNVEEKMAQPDWVILRLNKSFDDRYLKPDVQGVYDKEELYAFLPLLNPKSGELKVKRIGCRSIQKTILVPEYTAEHSPIVFLQCDHNITKGFSGLTLFRLDQQNEYSPVAVLSHIRAIQQNNEDILVSQYIVATNLSCLPFNGEDKPASCDFKPSHKMALKEEIMISQLVDTREKIEEDIKVFTQEYQGPIVWETTAPEKLDALPDSYKNFFKRQRQIPLTYLNNEKRDYLSFANVPIYAKCVRPEYLPEKQGQFTQIPTEYPAIEVNVSTNDNSQIQTEYRIEKLQAYVQKGPGNSYYLAASQPYASYRSPKNNLIGDKFHHLSYSIPLCDPGQ